MFDVEGGATEVESVKVLIAGRPTLFRHGLQVILRHHQPSWHLQEVDSFSALLNALESEIPNLLLLDEQLPDMDGAGGLRRLRAMIPQAKIPLGKIPQAKIPLAKILVLADSDHRGRVLDFIDSGAHGYLTKSSDQAQVLAAVNTVLCGGVFAPASLIQSTTHYQAASYDRPQPGLGAITLTERQREVFDLLSQGHATKTIARELGLAVGTVKVHLAAIYRLLGAHNRTEAVARLSGASMTLPRLSRPVITQPTPLEKRLGF